MTKPQRVLLNLLSNSNFSFSRKSHPQFLEAAQNETQGFSSEELAQLYVHTALLMSSMQFLKEEHWLKNGNTLLSTALFKSFVEDLMKSELLPLSFLQSYLESSSLAETKIMAQKAEVIENLVIESVKTKSFPEQKSFAVEALDLMSDLFDLESRLQREKKLQGLTLGLSMYRTFDKLDDVFNLNYQADVGMKTDLHGTERLYEGAGVGVQSGYSTVLTALRHLNPAPGARFIDLGSGYGRVGLVVGLMRPDIDFIGYEYVPHRVSIAKTTTAHMSMQSHVHFFTQDLSLKEFQIPDAEIYYMYDPFSEETYGHVLSQLIEISRRKKVVIVTKGNARGWLMDVVRHEGWPPPEEFDSGNLCLFHS